MSKSQNQFSSEYHQKVSVWKRDQAFLNKNLSITKLQILY